MSQGGSAAIREAIEAKRSKIKTPGVSLKTLEKDAKRKKEWCERGEKAWARQNGLYPGEREYVRVWVTDAFEENMPLVSLLSSHGSRGSQRSSRPQYSDPTMKLIVRGEVAIFLSSDVLSGQEACRWAYSRRKAVCVDLLKL